MLLWRKFFCRTPKEKNKCLKQLQKNSPTNFPPWVTVRATLMCVKSQKDWVSICPCKNNLHFVIFFPPFKLTHCNVLTCIFSLVAHPAFLYFAIAEATKVIVNVMKPKGDKDKTYHGQFEHSEWINLHAVTGHMVWKHGLFPKPHKNMSGIAPLLIIFLDHWTDASSDNKNDVKKIPQWDLLFKRKAVLDAGTTSPWSTRDVCRRTSFDWSPIALASI